MSMCDRNIGSITKNTPEDHHHRRKAAFNHKGGFYFLRFLLILLLIPLLSLSCAAENLTCNRLPKLMEGLLANHYATKNMTGEINTHAVDQMIKRLDPSKTLLYESDVGWLKPALHSAFTSMQAGNCAVLQQVYDLWLT